MNTAAAGSITAEQFQDTSISICRFQHKDHGFPNSYNWAQIEFQHVQQPMRHVRFAEKSD